MRDNKSQQEVEVNGRLLFTQGLYCIHEEGHSSYASKISFRVYSENSLVHMHEKVSLPSGGGQPS